LKSVNVSQSYSKSKSGNIIETQRSYASTFNIVPRLRRTKEHPEGVDNTEDLKH